SGSCRVPGLGQLALGVGGDAGDAAQVLGHHVLVVDQEAEGFLQPGHQGEHADRVDDAGLEQVHVEAGGAVVAGEGGDDEVVDDVLRGSHADVWNVGTGGRARHARGGWRRGRIGTDCGD